VGPDTTFLTLIYCFIKSNNFLQKFPDLIKILKEKNAATEVYAESYTECSDVAGFR
jgi:hypothetical protein